MCPTSNAFSITTKRHHIQCSLFSSQYELSHLTFSGIVCDKHCVGSLSAAFVQTEEVSRCYSVNGNSSCYYTDGSVLSWDDAKEFCESKNTTLPIITDDDVDNVFQQFVVGDANSVIRDRSVWIGAHAQPVTNLNWHWINGSSSGNANVVI